VVVERAVSAERVAPQPMRTAQFGVAIAVLLGIALAYLMDTLDRRARSVAEIGSVLGFPVLGELPRMRRTFRSRRLLAPVLDAPLGPAAEAFRFLETNVTLAPVGTPHRAVLVTSAGRREGKTTVAFNFALSAAEAGKRVLLVELDFRQPRLRDATDASGACGVAEIVRGTARLSDVAIEIEVPVEPGVAPGAGSVTLVRAGKNVSNPLQYLRAEPTAALFHHGRESFDLVVVDVPPLFGVADAMVASSLVDGVLLVVDFRRANRPRLADLLDVTRQLPAPVIGVVVNHAPRRPPAPPQEFGRSIDEPKRIVRAA
jgi:capsular exopolysaccharide synthesis family protein